MPRKYTLSSDCSLHQIQERKLRKETEMADVRVTCITKPHPLSPHEHISHLGNPQAGWEWTREQVIASIEAGTNTFYVLDNKTGKRADVAVVRPPGRAPFLRTHADGYWNDNLLALDQCRLVGPR
jgi:Protein of unknown function (DUF3892)